MSFKILFCECGVYLAAVSFISIFIYISGLMLPLVYL